MAKFTTRVMLAAASLLIVAGGASPAAAQPREPATAQERPIDMADVERMLSGRSRHQGAELERLIAAAAAHPLGSKENPVRAAMPAGQRAYLRRLRCQDSKAPQFTRVGNFGAGVYGNIIDGYELTCAGAKPVVVFMDMYHAGHVEDRPVAGFTIAAAGPIV
jgi:hypothetical protein